MQNQILFSIIVPTYNRAHLISSTLDSILAQTYIDFELLIIDDGSTDNTEEVVQNYLSDKVLYFKKTNGERSAARNFGTAKARGEYLNWIDSDDLIYSNHLAEAECLISDKKRPEVFSMGYEYRDTGGNMIFASDFPSDVRTEMYKGNQFAMSGVFVRKDIALNNLFNEDRELSASEDYELWLRLASQYFIHTSTAKTVIYVWHDERSTVKMKDPGQLISRYTKFLYYTCTNVKVLALLKGHIGFFKMKTYLMLAVDLVLNKQRVTGLKYLFMGFISSPKIVRERGFYAFIKHFLR